MSDRAAPSWLEDQVYGPKRQRTIELVTRTVDTLVAQGVQDHGVTRVSLSTIVAHSKHLDPAGKGVSHTAILGNAEARAYYEQHRTQAGARSSRPRPRLEGEESGPVKADRDLTRVRQRYLRLSKAELVERLVAAEQAQARQHARWLAVNDSLLTWQLRAEQAERRLQAPPYRAPSADGSG